MEQLHKKAREIREVCEIGGNIDGMLLLFHDDLYQIFIFHGDLKVFRNGFEQYHLSRSCTGENLGFAHGKVMAAMREEHGELLTPDEEHEDKDREEHVELDAEPPTDKEHEDVSIVCWQVKSWQVKRGWTGKFRINFDCPICYTKLSSEATEIGIEDSCPRCFTVFALEEGVASGIPLDRKRLAKERQLKIERAEEKKRCIDAKAQRLACRKQEKIDQQKISAQKEKLPARAKWLIGSISLIPLGVLLGVTVSVFFFAASMLGVTILAIDRLIYSLGID